jgi:hypothetical protein
VEVINRKKFNVVDANTESPMAPRECDANAAPKESPIVSGHPSRYAYLLRTAHYPISESARDCREIPWFRAVLYLHTTIRFPPA